MYIMVHNIVMFHIDVWHDVGLKLYIAIIC